MPAEEEEEGERPFGREGEGDRPFFSLQWIARGKEEEEEEEEKEEEATTTTKSELLLVHDPPPPSSPFSPVRVLLSFFCLALPLPKGTFLSKGGGGGKRPFLFFFTPFVSLFCTAEP